jgi:mycothiol synthase
MPGFNLATDTQLVLAPGGRVAAFGLVWDLAPHSMPETWGRVHPDHLGRGLGTYLAQWAEARGAFAVAEAPPGERVALRAWINDHDTATHALLRNEGYALMRHNLRMVIEFDAPPPSPRWPAGVTARSFVPGQDDRETLTVVRACFRDHWGWVEEPFEEDLRRWQYFMATDAEFDPSLRFLAIADGRIIGTSFGLLKVDDDPSLGWIATVGVVREWRRRGLAQALLYQTFGALYARGRRKIGLGVDAASLTGATRLYEKVGMRPDPKHQYGIWEKELRPGK